VDTQLGWYLLLQHEVFELFRAFVAQCRMFSDSVVEDLNVIKDTALRLLSRVISLMVYQLGLERVKE